MKTIATVCFAAMALSTAFVALVPVLPASAEPITTTEHITWKDGMEGTRTTTFDTNTTTVVDSVSKTFSNGERTEVSVKVVTNGNPPKTQTIDETEKFFHPDGSPGATWTTKTTRTYNEAGGFTFTSTTVKTGEPDAHGGTITIERKDECDAAGNVLSGTTTVVTTDKNGKVGETDKRDDKGNQEPSYPLALQTPTPLRLGIPAEALEGNKPTPTPTPAPEAPPSHHTSIWGILLGVGAVVAILASGGNHSNSGSNANNPPAGNSQLTFTPASESICLNKFANATVKDPSNPSAQFQVVSQNTSIVQIGSAMTNGPIDLTPFGAGSTNVTATEVGTNKMGTLPVTVTPAC